MQTGSENIANRLEEPVAYEENKDSTVAQYLDEVTDQTNFKDGVNRMSLKSCRNPMPIFEYLTN